MSRSRKGDPSYDRDCLAIAARQSFKRMMRADGRAFCEVCRWTPPFEDTWSMLQANHIIPVCCGGSDDFANLILLCPNHHAVCGYFLKTADRRTGVRRYYGPKTREELIAWLLRMDQDPEAWARQQAAELSGALAGEL